MARVVRSKAFESSSLRGEWLGDVDSNHDKQSQSLLSYR